MSRFREVVLLIVGVALALGWLGASLPWIVVAVLVLAIVALLIFFAALLNGSLPPW